jgi:hypothetical protein
MEIARDFGCLPEWPILCDKPEKHLVTALQLGWISQ